MMKGRANYDATNPDTGFEMCAVCDNAIVGGRWFARISHGGCTVALCCPLCTEVFEAKPEVFVRRVAAYTQLPGLDAVEHGAAC
jgi:hypothetical protein